MVNSRTKGSSFERKIAKALESWSGIQLRRTPLSGGFAKSGDVYKGDINAIDLSANWIFHVECKKYKSFHLDDLFNDRNIIDKWWEQCIRDCPTGKKPILIFQKNNGSVYVMGKRGFVFEEWNGNNFMRIYGETCNRDICLFEDFLKTEYMFHVNFK